MASERNRPRRPFPWQPLRGRDPGPARSADARADDVDPTQMDPETRLDEGVVAGAARDRGLLQIANEIERLRETEGQFEEKYHTSFDEFKARYRPGDDPQADADYLEWASVVERLRQLRAALDRGGSPRARPPAEGSES